MSIYETILSELVTRLGLISAAAITDGEREIEVTKLLQYKGNYKQLNNTQKGRITVGLWQNRYGTEATPTGWGTGNSVQGRDIYFVCTMTGRELEGDYGVYDLIDKTERLLEGFKPSTGGEISMAGVEITDFKVNDWYYQLIIKNAGVPLIPIDNPREELPVYPGNITEIDYEYELNSPDIVTAEGQNIVIDGENLVI